MSIGDLLLISSRAFGDNLAKIAEVLFVICISHSENLVDPTPIVN